MTLTSGTDAAIALDAIRAQRAAASAVLAELELYQQLEPRAECRVEWSGPASLQYESDLAALRARLSGVRSGLRGAVDDLWIAIGQATDA